MLAIIFLLALIEAVLVVAAGRSHGNDVGDFAGRVILSLAIAVIGVLVGFLSCL